MILNAEGVVGGEKMAVKTGKISARVLEHLHNFYKENPYTELLGLAVEAVEYGKVTLSMQVENRLCNFYKIAHGGALLSMADTAMGATCLSVNKKVVTQALSNNFIKAAPEGTKLYAVGRVLHGGRRTMVCETEVKDAEGTLYCKATGNFFVIGDCVEEDHE